MDSSPSTPMRLRSVCRQYGCNVEVYSDGGSPRSSPSHLGQQLKQSSGHHLYHNHHHHNHQAAIHQEIQTSSHHLRKTVSSSQETNTEVLQALNDHQVTPSKKGIGHLHSVQSATATRSAAETNHRMRRSYSDYSSGNEDSDSELREKTDYTYAKSGSYSSRVTPSRSWENPNMSRTRLSRSLHSSNQSSSSEEDFLLFSKGVGLLTTYDRTNGTPAEQSAGGSFVKSSRSSMKLKNADYSTTIKHSYGLDSEYSESEDDNPRTHAQNHWHTEESAGFGFLASNYLQRITFIRWLSGLNWLWYNSWSALYKLVCHVLLFDTWLLSRSSSMNKAKLFCVLLLPLFLPFLFLLGQHLFNSGYCDVATSLSNTSLTMMSNLLPFTSSLFASWRHTDALSGSSAGSKTSDDSGWSLWSYLFGPNSNLVSRYTDASSVVENSRHPGNRDEIQNIVRNIFKEELAGWMAGVSKEHEASLRRQMDEYSQQTIDLKTLQQNHLQHLTMELADLKLSIQNNNMGAKSEGEKNLDREFVQSKLDHLEGQLHGMQEILLSLRNCCRNQTDYINVAERHLATLLIQIMNGTGQSEGPFAAFGDWMRSRFVNHDELKAHVTSMADHISSDMTQQTETIARQAVAALIFKSINEIKSNMSIAQTKVERRNATETCASEEEIKTIVREAIYLYDADKTGLVDYALESSGGSVISTRCAETYHTGTAQFRLFGIPFWYTSNSPRTVIQPEVHPGQCWAFKGTHGYLVIELSANIKPTAFSLEHIPKSLSPTGSIDSAPREFSVMGLKKETDLEGIFLGRYTYNADGEPLQYFAVEDPNVDSYPIMELRIHSNYGNTEYTCLYRFRVHGTRQ